MNQLAPLQPGKRLDGFPGLLFGKPQVVEALQIEPKLRTGAKEVSEAEGRIAGDGARGGSARRHL
jgi:hypothetical protein